MDALLVWNIGAGRLSTYSTVALLHVGKFSVISMLLTGARGGHILALC